MPLPDSALVKKLGAFIELTAEEKAYLVEIQSKRIKVQPGQELLHEGGSDQNVFILQSGWANSYKDLPDGGRQIINFPVPGDCIGLRNVLLKKGDHSFSALTNATVSFVNASRMLQLIDEQPRLRSAFLWSAARDESMVVDRLVSIGRRGAIQRTAHFFIELNERLTLVGLATDTQFHWPLNQSVLADALGLSAIHVNRVLRQLRERNLMTVRSSNVTIHDLRALRAIVTSRRETASQNGHAHEI